MLMKIVIVEDEIRIREGIVKLLGKIGEEYLVVGEACDGKEGLKLCQKETPDLIITDIRMPEMDGIEMLAEYYRLGFKSKAIVLSAYSEFEYARGAMKLGVTEYLLKPISLMDFSNALENIKVQIHEESLKKPEKIGTLEQTFRDFFYGNTNLDDAAKEYIETVYHIDTKKSVWMVCTYLGNQYEENSEKCIRLLKGMFDSQEGISYVILDDQYRKSLLTIVYEYKDIHELERWLQYRILQHDADGLVFGCIEAESPLFMKEAFEKLFPYMDWYISFDKEVLISFPKITQVQTVFCTYPMDVENKMRMALCGTDISKINKAAESFHSAFADGKIYEPKEIKESYVRFLWFVMEIAKDLGKLKNRKIERQKLLERIMNAKTRSELMAISNEVLNIVTAEPEVEEDVSSITVKRAKSIIHEYYNTGITLDEIASRLNITPEYLGTIFHNESGENFSSYIRNYRMAKAKELLLGTNLKLYEIAERVGYSDPKYFSRVFKESTGMLPADFRKSK